MPKQQATQQIISKVQDDLTQIYSGIQKNFDPGTPPQLAQQVVQQWMSQTDVQQRLANDPAFQARAESYIKMIAFQIQQHTNAVTGRLGAAPAPMGG